MNCLAAPIRTTAGSGRRRLSAVWSRAVPMGLVTTHDLALADIVEQLALTRLMSILKITWRTAVFLSTIGCDREL